MQVYEFNQTKKIKSISLSENANFASVYMVLCVVPTCKTERIRKITKVDLIVLWYI